MDECDSCGQDYDYCICDEPSGCECSVCGYKATIRENNNGSCPDCAQSRRHECAIKAHREGCKSYLMGLSRGAFEHISSYNRKHYIQGWDESREAASPDVRRSLQLLESRLRDEK